MPELLVSKFLTEPSDLGELLSQFGGMRVQLGFYSPGRFFEIDHSAVNKACKENGVDIRSVHAPTIDIFETAKFFRMLGMIKDGYGVDNVTIHPSAGSTMEGFTLLDRFSQQISDLDLYLLYENFDSSKKNKRWLPRAKNIYLMSHPSVYLTYDTSHVKIGTDVASDIKEYLPKMGMVHLSGKSRVHNHIPIAESEHDMGSIIEALKGYPGYVCLEYMRMYEEQAKQDYKMLEDRFKR